MSTTEVKTPTPESKSVKEYFDDIKNRKFTPFEITKEVVAKFNKSESILQTFIVSYILLFYSRKNYRKSNKVKTTNSRLDLSVRDSTIELLKDANQYGLILAATLFYYCQTSLSNKARLSKYILNLEDSTVTTRKIISAIDSKSSNDEIDDEISKIAADLNQPKELDSQTVKVFLTTLCILSDSLNDLSNSALAAYIDFDVYCSVLLDRVDSWNTTAPASALIKLYLDKFEPKYNHIDAKKEIQQSLAINNKDCLNKMINKFKENKQTAANNGGLKIIPDQIYDVYIGPTNFWKDITYTTKYIDTNSYIVAMYKNVLFDVIMENEKSLFTTLSWSERLAKFKNETHVIITQLSGREIQNIYDQRENSNGITISTTIDSKYQSYNFNVTQKHKYVISDVSEDSPKKKKKRNNDENDLLI